MKAPGLSKLPWYDAAATMWREQYTSELALEKLTDVLKEEIDQLVQTRLGGLAGGTEATYRKAWNRWAAYASSRGMRQLPATEVGVLAWMRNDLAYTVKAKYFQPYLSALNKAHAHCQLPPVAVGDAIGDSKRSIARQQLAVFEATTRVRLPIEYASQILDAGLAIDLSVGARAEQLLRAAIAVCVDASCGSRGNTGVHIRAGDVQLDGAQGHVVRLRSLKGEIEVDELSGDEKVIRFPAGAVRGLEELIQKWEKCRQALGLTPGGRCASVAKESWYRLPGEEQTWNWNTDMMNKFLNDVLKALSLSAPDSFSYSWHSLRHMAASSQSAINVADTKIMYLQNWSSMRVALDTYIDPLCPVTPGCYRWFGWLLPPTRAEVERAADGATVVFNL